MIMDRRTRVDRWRAPHDPTMGGLDARAEHRLDEHREALEAWRRERDRTREALAARAVAVEAARGSHPSSTAHSPARLIWRTLTGRMLALLRRPAAPTAEQVTPPTSATGRGQPARPRPVRP
jgi:hypothetical protein